MIGVGNLESSLLFYTKMLRYSFKRDFIDSGTNRTGVVIGKEGSPDLLLVPFKAERLPSPQHMAFEVSQDHFKELYNNFKAFNVWMRPKPSLSCPEYGTSRIEENNSIYERFFIVDPNEVNIEFMNRVGGIINKNASNSDTFQIPDDDEFQLGLF